MRLKSVKIVGFKTFADKTEFDLDGDIIAVVGPNGCGKSNIVDAILWGLGESNSRTLRAQTGRDVIFSGSASRKPVNVAEVTLRFENEDGALPIETPEVTVTRRIERSGETQCFINRRPCRLKDVHDLLADSGLGRAGYAIVGQSEIDQALAASPEQRRAWIDEAAGVQRYRLRRQEAVRRLAQTSDHLKRVEDVLRELETQRAPLEEQASTARRYKALVAELRTIEVGLLAHELGSAMAELTTQRQEATEAKAACDAEEALALSESQESERFERLAREWETKRDHLDSKRQEVQVRLERAKSAEQVAQSRLQALDQLERSLAEDADSGKERVAQAETDLAAAQQALAARQDELSRAEESLGLLGKAGAAFAKRLAEAEKTLAEARKRESDRQRAEIQEAHRAARLSAIEVELQGIEAAIPELEEALASAECALRRESAESQALRDRLNQIQRERRRIRDEEESILSDQRELLTEAASLEGRRAGLEASIDSHEGLTQGSRSVLRLVEEGRLTDDYRPIGECVQVDPEFAVAVETALGSAVNDLIVPDEGAAKRAIALLREERLGRATFRPLTLVRPRPPVGLPQGARASGIIGRASDLVRCEARHRPVIEALLGRILIVDTLDHALRLARLGEAARLVTLDGETVHGSGAVTGGRSARPGSGLIQRQAELASVVEAIAGLTQRTEALGQAIKALAEERALLETEESGLAAEVRKRTTAESEARDWAKSIEHELGRTRRDAARLTSERASLMTQEFDLGPPVDIEAAQAARDAAWAEHSGHVLDREAVKERLHAAREALFEAQSTVAERQRRLVSVRALEASRQVRFKEIGPQRRRLAEELSKAKLETEELERTLGSLAAQIEEANSERRLAVQESQFSRHREAAARQAADAQRRRLHEAELKAARAEGRRAAALGRLLEDYGLSEAEAMGTAPSEPSPQASQRAASLRREIKAMGEVNLGAVAAYEGLMGRIGELSGQRKDVLAAARDIEAGIRELDLLTRQRFDETFEQVRAHFSQVFHRLFGGGEASLDLVDGEGFLDAGIEIQVTVPGKKRQRLELLSGGERALSAIAFLFALLRSRPSPIVILDEVDAPLDGRNVDRFVSLMRETSRESQFILVTHNPVTIESADVWLGVTMQEPGVSSLVPYRAGPVVA